MLSRKKVLLTGSIDTKDKTYLRWKDEKIGLGEFLKYAINKEWIDISMLLVFNYKLLRYHKKISFIL